MRVQGNFNPQANLPSDDGYSPPSEGWYVTTITKDTKDYVKADGTCTAFQLRVDIDPSQRIPGDGHTMGTFINYYEKDSTTVLSAGFCKLLHEALGIPLEQLMAHGYNGDPCVDLVGRQIGVYWKPNAKQFPDKNTGEMKWRDDFRVISRQGFAARQQQWKLERQAAKGAPAAPAAAPPAFGTQAQAPASFGAPPASAFPANGVPAYGAPQQNAFPAPAQGGFPGQGGFPTG